LNKAINIGVHVLNKAIKELIMQ